ncbi:tRNA (adenosine(37)-N6)-threonylcarbamoyltransferase complex ATPase subunit type 1 TsaE [Leptobacterium sp. I13]|uniref:tRNA (adenosine(37)-N6)-threonylcarbamoyltransferase complex ATPase subunit type 1 TsaE n=1 Tax=Leptobacterium meishanense TaxID=3128904 RepID=UPI0030EB9CD6
MTITYKLEDIDTIAKKILAYCSGKVFLFYGDMGVGKTTLIKSMAKQLGVTHPMSSPSFSLVNEYLTNDVRIYHFDMYRINNENEALDIGFEAYLEKDGYLFIEWPEKIPNLIPFDAHKVYLKVINDHERTAKF